MRTLLPVGQLTFRPETNQSACAPLYLAFGQYAYQLCDRLRCTVAEIVLWHRGTQELYKRSTPQLRAFTPVFGLLMSCCVKLGHRTKRLMNREFP